MLVVAYFTVINPPIAPYPTSSPFQSAFYYEFSLLVPFEALLTITNYLQQLLVRFHKALLIMDIAIRSHNEFNVLLSFMKVIQSRKLSEKQA